MYSTNLRENKHCHYTDVTSSKLSENCLCFITELTCELHFWQKSSVGWVYICWEVGSICPQWRTAVLWWLCPGSVHGYHEYLAKETIAIRWNTCAGGWLLVGINIVPHKTIQKLWGNLVKMIIINVYCYIIYSVKIYLHIALKHTGITPPNMYCMHASLMWN